MLYVTFWFLLTFTQSTYTYNPTNQNIKALEIILQEDSFFLHRNAKRHLDPSHLRRFPHSYASLLNSAGCSSCFILQSAELAAVPPHPTHFPSSDFSLTLERCTLWIMWKRRGQVLELALPRSKTVSHIHTSVCSWRIHTHLVVQVMHISTSYFGNLSPWSSNADCMHTLQPRILNIDRHSTEDQ